MELFKYPILIHNHRYRQNKIPGFYIESRFSSSLKQVKWPARKPSAVCQGFSWNPAVLWDVGNNRNWRFFWFWCFFKYPELAGLWIPFFFPQNTRTRWWLCDFEFSSNTQNRRLLNQPNTHPTLDGTAMRRLFERISRNLSFKIVYRIYECSME